MPVADYQVLVDWNNDGDFLDTGEDISSRVLTTEQAMTWERGRDMSSQLEGRAIAGQLKLILNNESGDYSSFNTSSPLAGNILPGRKVQVRKIPFLGHCLKFDGVDDLVNCGSDASVDNIFDGGGTIECWVEVNGEGGGAGGTGRMINKVIWAIRASGESGGKVKLNFFYTWSGTDGGWETDALVLTNGDRHHIAVTYNADAVGNDPIIYVDGVSVAITETTGPPTGTRDSDASSDLIIGNETGGSTPHDGLIDEVRLWSDIRTAQEISDNKDIELQGNEAGLVGYWRFNEGSGTTAEDGTANNNDGTITGATYDHVGSILWTGYLESITPMPSVGRGDRAELIAIGPLGWMNQKEVQLAMGTSKATGTSVGDILDEVGWASGDRKLDTGKTTMDRFWVDRMRTIAALRMVEVTEAGFIYEAKDGHIIFEDRHHRLGSPHQTSQATFSDAAGAARTYLDNLVQDDPLPFIFNEFVATVQRYTVGALATLWTLSESGANSPSIDVGETKDFWANYPNPDSATDAFGVDAWTTPVSTTDYTANSQADGGGDDLTASMTISVTKFGNAMKISITNDATVKAFITLLQARGTPITRDDPITIRELDATSQTDYGERTFPSEARFVPDSQEALDWARFHLGIYKDPIPMLELSVVANKSSAHFDEVMERDISDRITVVANNQAGLGINQDFFIESERHQVMEGGMLHIVTWRLSTADKFSDFWVLDSSALDTETRLAY